MRPGKRTMCWDVSSSENQAPVLLWGCHGSGGNQLWRYDMVSRLNLIRMKHNLCSKPAVVLYTQFPKILLFSNISGGFLDFL